MRLHPVYRSFDVPTTELHHILELELPRRIALFVHVSKSVDELFDLRPAQRYTDRLQRDVHGLDHKDGDCASFPERGFCAAELRLRGDGYHDVGFRRISSELALELW